MGENWPFNKLYDEWLSGTHLAKCTQSFLKNSRRVWHQGLSVQSFLKNSRRVASGIISCVINVCIVVWSLCIGCDLWKQIFNFGLVSIFLLLLLLFLHLYHYALISITTYLQWYKYCTLIIWLDITGCCMCWGQCDVNFAIRWSYLWLVRKEHRSEDLCSCWWSR